MLICNTTLINFTLTLRCQEGWIYQDKPSQSLKNLTGDNSRRHASHRMTNHYWADQAKRIDKAHDVGSEVVIPIAMIWNARVPMSSSIWHNKIVIFLRRPRYRSPARATRHEPMQQNNWGFVS